MTFRTLALAALNIALWPFYTAGFLVGLAVKTAVTIANAIAIGYSDGRGD